MMKKTKLLALAPAGVAALLLLGAGKGSGPADGYEVKGKYYETCACTVSCPCASNKFLPTEGHCDAVSLFHIDKGQAEGVAMDGLNIALVIRSPHGEKVMDALSKGQMDLLSMYIDEKANEKQREAMPRLLGALFGTKEIKGARPPVFVPISLEVKGDAATFQIAGGQKLSAEIENIDVGPETKNAAKRTSPSKRISLTNSAPFPWVGGITQGYSHKFTYDDYDTKWEYKDRNAFFGTFHSKGSLPPEQKKG